MYIYLVIVTCSYIKLNGLIFTRVDRGRGAVGISRSFITALNQLYCIARVWNKAEYNIHIWCVTYLEPASIISTQIKLVLGKA